MICFNTSATMRNLISLSLPFWLQKKAEHHKKGRKKKILVVSVAQVKACERSVRKLSVNTTGLLCRFPPKPLHRV